MRSSARFFSVIVPVYDVAPYVGECLGSVSAQTCADWECLCVDDGSRDGSGALLDAYARRDPRFRVTHQRNAGVSVARNRALDITNGQWVWFVDGDDRLREGALGMLQDALKAANDPQVAAVAFAFKEGVSFPTVWAEAKPPYVSSERTLAAWWHFRLSAFRTLFRRDAIGNLRFKRYSIGEDCLFSAMFFFRISRWMMWDASLYFYRVRPGSAMHSRPSVRGVTDWLLVQREFLALLGADGRLDNIGGGRDLYLPRWAMDFYYTSGEMFFRMTLRDMRRCYDLWLENHRLIEAWTPCRRHKRIILAILRHWRSPLLARMLVAWPLWLRRALRLP